MDKGQRVEITGGRTGVGVCGEIFWKGPNKWGSGDRYGVRGDDGETYWVPEDELKATTGKAPELEPGETFDKGDRVAFKVRGQDGTGSVFWVGQSKNGPGQRLGVRNDNGDDDAVWIDARQCTRMEGEAPYSAGRAQSPPDEGESEAPWSEPLSPSELPPPPPMDDAYLDSLAQSVDGEGDVDDGTGW